MITIFIRFHQNNSLFGEEISNHKEIHLPIERVVLYGNMAEITRSQNTFLDKGINYIEINDLPEKMMDETLQTDIGKSAELRKLEVLNVHKKIYLSEEAKKAEKNLKNAEIHLNELTNQYKALSKEMVFLENLDFLTHDRENPAENRLNLSLWKSALTFFHTSYAENQKKMNDILPEIDHAREEFYIAMTVANRYKSGIQKKSKTCIIEIMSHSKIEIPLRLTYRIKDAGWFPSYIARITPENGTKATGEITWYAFVKNETGEDWINARLIFSTSDPEESVHFPKISSRMIKYRERERDKYKSSKKSLRSMGKEDFAGTTADEAESEESPIQAKRIIRKNMPQRAIEQQVQIANRMESSQKAYDRSMSEVKDGRARTRSAASEEQVRNIQSAKRNMEYYYRNDRYDSAIQQSEKILESYANLPPQYQQHFEDEKKQAKITRENALKMKQNAEITDKFILPHSSSRGFDYRFFAKAKETIPSQKVFYTVFLKTENYPIRLFHEAVPYRSSHVFLTGAAKNQSGIPVLSGPMRVFYDNNFNGVMKIQTIAPNAEFTFHFGVDQNIKIIRKDSHYRSESGVFSGSFVNENKVKLQIWNNKSQNIFLKIYERIPYTRNDEVTVTSFKSNLKPDKKHKNGILEYHIPIKKKEKTGFEFSYEIVHDKDIMVIKNEYRDGSL